MNYKIQKGKEGELLVAQHLQKNGYTIITQNYRKRFGEVDIIAQKKDTVAFVEVKWRHNPLVDPAELIGPSKQKKIISIAKHFLSQHNEEEIICRFDVALIEDNSNSINLQYIENAFTAFD
ncbi:MAG TPA: YraN family protein [Candidatus Babeliales bacterium]|jgi:putative endonuclease|nr:YraN family protein [Candidatus Babeliales bacterium]